MKPESDRDKKRMKAYKATSSDEKAANALKISKASFRMWRRKFNLPSKLSVGRPQTFKPAKPRVLPP